MKGSQVPAYNIKKYREASGMTQDQMAEKLGVAQQTVQYYESGRSDIKSSVLMKMADVLGVSVTQLLGLDGEFEVVGNPIPSECYRPLYGRIPAGTPLEAIETPGETAWCDPDTAEAYPLGFFLTVSGDSMDLVYRPGGRVFVNPGEREIVSGKNYVVLVNGSDATLKQVFRAGDTIVLHPRSTNPAHKDISIDVTDPDAPYFSVVGKVVQYIGARE